MLNTDIKAFDKKFDDYLKTRFAGVLASVTKKPPEITRAMSVDAVVAAGGQVARTISACSCSPAQALIAHNEVDEAIPLLEKARDDVPRVRRRRQPVRGARDRSTRRRATSRKQADVLDRSGRR